MHSIVLLWIANLDSISDQVLPTTLELFSFWGRRRQIQSEPPIVI